MSFFQDIEEILFADDGRNDVAVEKSKALAATHGVKASAYKVDSTYSILEKDVKT